MRNVRLTQGIRSPRIPEAPSTALQSEGMIPKPPFHTIMNTQIHFSRHALWFGFLITLALTGTGKAFTLTLLNVDPITGGSSPVILKSGEGVPPGTGIVAGGYFTISDDAIQNATSITDLANGFVQFGDSIPFNNGNFGDNPQLHGLYAFSTSLPISINNHNFHFHGKTIYTFIGEGDSFANSNEVIVVKHTNSLFVESPFPGKILYVNQFDLEPQGFGEVLLGTFPGPDIGLDPFFGPTISTSYVPEVSRPVLSLFGVGVVLLRRRR